MADVLRENVAKQLAFVEYKIHLIVVFLGVAAVFYFGVGTEKSRNFEGILISLVIGYCVAYFVRGLYFSRRILKKYNEEQLRKYWLKYGGFSE